MELQPPSLNIPFERKERWGLRLLAACVSVAVVSALVNPTFAVVFSASAIVGLPVLYLLFFPSPASRAFAASGDFGRIAFYLALFGYIALAKSVLVPIVIGVIEHVFLS
ncbi:MAG: hypothetical protein ACOYYF_12885 [Chloroflexota bacterium]